jgi:sulfur-oxidizing protein SoxY
MSNKNPTRAGLTRRGFLGTLGAGTVAGLGLAPRVALAAPEDVTKAIEKIAGGKAVKEGRVSLKLPQIAENGNTVPVTLVVDSPMSAADHVKKVHVFADGNPLPTVASFSLGPQNGKAEVSLRMRLAKTQNIVGVAEMSDGSVFIAKQEIKVTIGGCGG